MTLDEVKPWGRTLEEYCRMFSLSETNLRGTILGCGDGPASFNAELTKLGHQVVSVDPIYAFTEAEIKRRVQETYHPILSQAEKNAERYVWDYFPDAEALGRARLRAMETFLDDFDAGLAEGRYVPGALPSLGFADGQFSLALCSHLLFLYSEQLPLEFHLAAITELLRVSSEARIFPLLDLECNPSPHVEPVMAYAAAGGFTAEICTVPYEFQRGANRMLRLYR